MRTTTRATLATIVAALVLVGCGGDPEPRIADPSGTPTTEASDDEPAPPALPAAASKEGEEGARAFVRHFWDVANYAQSTGDSSDLKALSAETCNGCQGAIDFVDGVYRDGGTISGGAYSVMDLRTTELRAGETQLFDCDFATTNTRQVVERPGKKRIVYPASTVDVQFTISFGPNGWQVDRWDVP